MVSQKADGVIMNGSAGIGKSLGLTVTGRPRLLYDYGFLAVPDKKFRDANDPAPRFFNYGVFL